MAQIKLSAGQHATIHGGNVWAGLPDGTVIISPIDQDMVVVAASEFNLVPVVSTPAVPVSPTSTVTVQPGPVAGAAIKT